MDEAIVKSAVARWLNDVVVGLNLCPFAGKPAKENRVRFFVSRAVDDENLLQDLEQEMKLLDVKAAADIETTLVIIPDHLNDFFDYNQFLNWAEKLIKRHHWSGVYQIASFHPDYCFAGANPDDAENLTNRSPYPILHIIREESLEKALEFYEGVEQVPENNKKRVESLTLQEKRLLFPYLIKN